MPHVLPIRAQLLALSRPETCSPSYLTCPRQKVLVRTSSNCSIPLQRSMRSRTPARRLTLTVVRGTSVSRVFTSATPRDLLFVSFANYPWKLSLEPISPLLEPAGRVKVQCKNLNFRAARLAYIHWNLQYSIDRAILRYVGWRDLCTWSNLGRHWFTGAKV